MLSKRKNKLFGKRQCCVLIISGAAILILLVCSVISHIVNSDEKSKQASLGAKQLPPITIEKKLLKLNKFSRAGIKLKKVNGIVVHYTANPGTDALENRDYFNNLPKLNKGKTKANSIYASSHFIIGLAGQIVQCIPTDEMSYASNDRNSDTISIECCHMDKSGEFTKNTYQSLVELVTFLCIKFDLDANSVIRHYDVTKKACPKYFVDNEDAWTDFKMVVSEKIKKYKNSLKAQN